LNRARKNLGHRPRAYLLLVVPVALIYGDDEDFAHNLHKAVFAFFADILNPEKDLGGRGLPPEPVRKGLAGWRFLSRLGCNPLEIICLQVIYC